MRAQIGPFTLQDLPDGYDPLWPAEDIQGWADLRCLVTWTTPQRTVTFDHGWISFMLSFCQELMACLRTTRRHAGAFIDDDSPDLMCFAQEDGTVMIQMAGGDGSTVHQHLPLLKESYSFLYELGRTAMAEGRMKAFPEHSLVLGLPVGAERMVWNEGMAAPVVD